jgi:arylsulfatase A-like enzyme
MYRPVARLLEMSLGMVVLLSGLVPERRAEAAAPARKPANIVFIFSDDHAYQAISAYKDARKLLETPNIDRLAREGTLFKRCIVPNSICGPSRASVLTGKYSHLNGFYNNSNSEFNGSQLTFNKLLRASGYQTAVVSRSGQTRAMHP